MLNCLVKSHVFFVWPAFCKSALSSCLAVLNNLWWCFLTLHNMEDASSKPYDEFYLLCLTLGVCVAADAFARCCTCAQLLVPLGPWWVISASIAFQHFLFPPSWEILMEILYRFRWNQWVWQWTGESAKKWVSHKGWASSWGIIIAAGSPAGIFTRNGQAAYSFCEPFEYLEYWPFVAKWAHYECLEQGWEAVALWMLLVSNSCYLQPAWPSEMVAAVDH